jgi:excisionase family DNA binding protein
MSRTHHIQEAGAKDIEHLVERVRAEIEELLAAGRAVDVTVADREDELTPQAVADRLGFSRQHVRRLMDAGELEAHQLPNSTHWRVPLRSVLAFEERREEAAKRADERSRALDELGAPLE